MTRWPLWRVLVWVEAWLIGVAAFHQFRPVHQDVIVPLLIGVVPGAVFVAFWALARAAVSHRAAPELRAAWIELLVTVVAVAGAVMWTGQWAWQAREDLRRLNAMVGQSTFIIDISLTGFSMAACFAALALDWILATAHEPLRTATRWLRRTHLTVTAVYVVALFGSAWLFTRWPDAPGSPGDLLSRTRVALSIYEFARATVFPVQALFAALAVLVTTADSRQGAPS